MQCTLNVSSISHLAQIMTFQCADQGNASTNWCFCYKLLYWYTCMTMMEYIIASSTYKMGIHIIYDIVIMYIQKLRPIIIHWMFSLRFDRGNVLCLIVCCHGNCDCDLCEGSVYLSEIPTRTDRWLNHTFKCGNSVSLWRDQLAIREFDCNFQSFVHVL